MSDGAERRDARAVRLRLLKSNWALGCIARDRCSDGRNALQRSRVRLMILRKEADCAS
jgi:hypothetical protein